MPHRHTVHWQDGPLLAEYEVETLTDGIVFYAVDPKLSGGDVVPSSAPGEVEAWLRNKFRHVEVDYSPKPAI